MEEKLKVVNEQGEQTFMNICNKLLNEGWKISSTYCGFVQSEKYDFCNSYQAILVRE